MSPDQRAPLLPSMLDNTDELFGELRRLGDCGWDIRTKLSHADGVWQCGELSLEGGDYPEDAHELSAAVEDRSPWYRSRNEIILMLARRYLTKTALWEVGAGNGVVSSFLQGHGFDVVAIEPTSAIRTAAKRGLKSCIGAHLEDLKLPKESLPAIGLFDVIEHIPNPKTILSEANRLLELGGVVLVTVPALQWLWSDVDQWSGHHRRYTPQSLVASFENAGFEAIEVSYCMRPLVAPIFLLRALPYRLGLRRNAEAMKKHFQSGLVPQSGLGEKILGKLLDWDVRAVRRQYGASGIAGSSIFAAFRKKGENRES